MNGLSSDKICLPGGLSQELLCKNLRLLRKNKKMKLLLRMVVDGIEGLFISEGYVLKKKW